jgi:DNA modification methylase
MITIADVVNGYKLAEARWARFGPYYAMFPVDFAFEIVSKYSQDGDFIIDPFAGRCSSIYAGGVLGRHSLGIEINPVGWLYGAAKLGPADQQEVEGRLEEIYKKRNYYGKAVNKMPIFYRMCYCDEVLKFLISARKNLDWKNDGTDATLMSILLVYLHGKLGEGVSNQMRMSKSMGQNYSMKWWTKKGLTTPPEINPLTFFKKKIFWRYEKGKPKVFDSQVIFGDSTTELEKIISRSQETGIKFSLLFTSPPYYSVTDYHADQWLRLWMLGGAEVPKLLKDRHKGRFDSKDEYYKLLDAVFANCAVIMEEESTIYVRTDRREYTYQSTLEILTKHFPDHELSIIDKPYKKRTQTEVHGNKSSETGEIDIVLTRTKS